MADLKFGMIQTYGPGTKQAVHFIAKRVGTVYRTEDGAFYYDDSDGGHDYTREQLLAIAAELE